jgi:hypothetical protein
MTSQQEQITMQEKLREVLGSGPAATLMSMLPRSEELATKTDLFEFRDELRGDMAVFKTELKGDMADFRAELNGGMADFKSELRDDFSSVRTEVAFLRQEIEFKYATKDDLLAAIYGFNDTISGHVRTFIVVQAATVVGMSGILYGLLRLT